MAPWVLPAADADADTARSQSPDEAARGWVHAGGGRQRSIRSVQRRANLLPISLLNCFRSAVSSWRLPDRRARSVQVDGDGPGGG